jgi:N-formylglutamate deformylase
MLSSTSSIPPVPSLGATLVTARFPRSYIDPNRSILDLDTSLHRRRVARPAIRSRKTELGIGLIWRILDSGETIYGRKLSVDEVKQRIVRYHQPYQKAVKDALDHAYGHFGAVWHMNLHSMPAMSGPHFREGPGKPRADFVLGDRDGTTCGAEFTDLVAGDPAQDGLRREDQRSPTRAWSWCARSRIRSATP